MPFEVFQAPATLRDQLIEFQTRQQCYPLTELEQLKEELSGYVGVYLLYFLQFCQLILSIFDFLAVQNQP